MNAFLLARESHHHQKVVICRTMKICTLLLFAIQVVAPQPRLSNKQRKHYNASLRFLRSVHGVNPDYTPVEYLPHIAPAWPNIESEVWETARTPGNGAVLWTLDDSERNIFATTKIPNHSPLARAWNLHGREDREAYAFWHINQDRHQLLRLDVWPAGGQPVEEAAIDWILERMRCLAGLHQSYRSAVMCFRP